MAKILVTGGTGFIGSALVKKLLANGHDVKVLDNNSRGNINKLGDVAKNIEMVQGDIRDFNLVSKAMKDIDVVYHLAFVNGTRYFYEKPDLVLEVGLKGTLNVLDAIKSSKVYRYIFASSAEVYQEPTHVPTSEDERLMIPDPRNPRYSYGGGKLIGEILSLHYLKDKDVQTVIFRPHNVYGPDMGYEHVIPEFITKMVELSSKNANKKIDFTIQGNGKQTRAFCYVDDAADGIFIVGEKGVPGCIYHVGTEDEISIAALAVLIAEELGVSIKIIPYEDVKGGTPRRCPSIKLARSLGYEPKISLHDGLRKTCEWYKQQRRNNEY
jgi:nucleoside-diphosphate-sugar epimerase